ncbi:MAG: hypothetical protein ABI744_03435 [Chloroflexota bacterium]
MLSLGITFEVGAGWVHQQSGSEFFDIERDPGSPDVIAVQFAGVNRPATDIANEIRARSDVAFDMPKGFDLNCPLHALRLTVTPTDTSVESPQFWPVVEVAAGTLSVASGRRLQLNILDLDAGTVIVMIGGSIAHWDATLAAAGPVLDSLHISPPRSYACD